MKDLDFFLNFGNPKTRRPLGNLETSPQIASKIPDFNSRNRSFSGAPLFAKSSGNEYGILPGKLARGCEGVRWGVSNVAFGLIKGGNFA